MTVEANGTESNSFFVTDTPRRYFIGFVVWTMLALLTAGRNHLTYLRLGYDVPISTTLVSSFTDFYLWALTSIFIFNLCAKFPLEKPALVRKTLVYLLLSVILTFVLAIISVPIFLFLSGGDFAELRNIFESIVFSPWNLYQGFITFWGVIVVGHAVQFSRRARERDKRLQNLSVQLAEAKLSALKMQLQPHFLFNTLNSIAALLRRDADRAEQMIAYLGEFLRMTLNASKDNQTTLETELQFTETYLKIEKIRFQDKLETSFQIAPEALPVRVPTLILQPLVENAIRHGFGDKSEDCRLLIRAEKLENRLRIEVRDNGIGFAENVDINSASGVGLRNTRLRLRETYDDDYRFEAGNNGTGAVIEIEIPAMNSANKI
jgi:two-component system LytT family sensor kinase